MLCEKKKPAPDNKTNQKKIVFWLEGFVYSVQKSNKKF